MSAFVTPTDWTAPATGEAVVLPRWHILAIAILTCVPLPLLSLAATVVPLPQLLERAAATFISIGAPALGDDRPGIRERAVAVRSLEILYEPLDYHPATPANDRSARGSSNTELEGVGPGGGAADRPGGAGSAGSAGGTGGAGDPPTGADSPSGGSPPPDAPTEPPSPTPSAPGKGGDKGGGTSNGPGGGGKGGGTSNGPGGGGGGHPSDGGSGGSGSGAQGGGPSRPA